MNFTFNCYYYVVFYTGDKDGYATITETLASLQSPDGSLKAEATITSSVFK